MQAIFPGRSECRVDYAVNHAGLWRDLSVTGPKHNPILYISHRFYPRPLRQSGKQGTSRTV